MWVFLPLSLEPFSWPNLSQLPLQPTWQSDILLLFMPAQSVDVIFLAQRQLVSRLSGAKHPIRFYAVALRIHLHLRHDIVELHIFLANISAVFDRLNALLQPIAGHETGVDAGLANKRYACTWDKGSEHWSHNDWLHCWYGGVGITLNENVNASFFFRKFHKRDRNDRRVSIPFAHN